MDTERRYRHSNGYWLLKRPDHPYRNNHGYVPEARLVMEEIIGRFISPLIEDVHHKDENVQNNEPSNLVLLTKVEHTRLHRGWKLIDGEWWKPCSECGRLLKADGNFYKRKTGHNEYVSRCMSCERTIQLAKYHQKAEAHL